MLSRLWWKFWCRCRKWHHWQNGRCTECTINVWGKYEDVPPNPVLPERYNYHYGGPDDAR